MERNPALAGLLSFLLPGMGQIDNGHFLRGLFWLVVTPGLWLGSGGFLGWVCHFLAAYTAHRKAEDAPGAERSFTRLRSGRG